VTQQPIRLRYHLVLLVLAAVLPLLVFAGAAVYHELRQHRDQFESRVLDTARALSLAVDRQIVIAQSISQTLAGSQYLDARDFAAFHKLASAAAEQVKGGRILLFDLDGQQIINTLRPYGAPLPNPFRDSRADLRDANYPDLPLGSPGTVKQAIATRQPVISDLFLALSTRAPTLSINLPIIREARVLYILEVTLGLEAFTDLLRQHQPPPEWFGALFDRNNVVVARTRDAEKFVGKKASRDLIERISQGNEGAGTGGRNLEGEPVYIAFMRSKVTGWVAAIGVPQSWVNAQLQRPLYLLMGGSMLLLLLSVAGALLLGRRLSGPIAALAKSAESIQRGEPVAIDNLAVFEVQALHNALVSAGEAAKASAAERERRIIAEAREAEAEAARDAIAEREAVITTEAKSLARLNELSSRLWGMPTLSRGLEEMLDATIELLGADMGNVQIVDPNRRVLVIAAQRGFQPAFLNIFREVTAEDDSACARALGSGKRVIIEDVETDPAYEPLRPVARAAGYRAVQSTPLIASDGTPLGMLSTHFREVHSPSEPELRRLELYARQAVDFIERCQREGALQASEERFRLLLAGVQDRAIFMLDEQGRIATWNTGAERLTGFRYEEAIRCPLEILYEPADRKAGKPDRDLQAAAAAAAAAAADAPYEQEGWFVRKDFSRFRANVTLTALRNEDKTLRGYACVIHDVTESRRMQEALLESEARFRLALQDSPMVVFTCDKDLRFTWVHNSQPPVTDPARILGKRDDEVLAPESVRDLIAIKQRVLTTGIGERREVVVPHNGENYYFDYGIEAIRNQAGEIIGLRGAALDITKLKRIEAALRESETRKDEFIATLSHELRNPLAPIRNAVQIMKQPNVSAEHLQIARDIIDRQLNQMVRLIDDLLDVSRISRGKIELKRQRVTLKAIVDQAIETSRPHIEENGHRLRVSLPAETIYLNGDEVRLAQVLSNLINNASKYSEQNGNIEVAARLQASEGGAQELVLSVKDTGFGIAREHLGHVFDMFSQVESTLARSEGGLGIGLSLVRALVELHGGTVEAKSEGIGKGSEFIVRLPVMETKSAEVEISTTARLMMLGQP